ncbi:MAG: amidohydrolase family protein [Deltaproteobacteria bacterium]|nr:amidohydrolase family protein [Deltaproteobacteria bacterium]
MMRRLAIMLYDLLITGGQVFDPLNKSFKKADMAVAGGRVARIAPSLEGEKASEVIDASGLMVTPGLIDFHVHIFWLVHRISIHPHNLVPRAGTTTMVDGGSAGAANFDAFKEFILTKSELNLLAFLNISILGQIFETQIPGMPSMNEYEDLRLVNVSETVKCIEANRDLIVGVKVRAFHGLTNLTPVHAALDAAEEADVPVMIHTSPPPPSVSQYMPLLRPGDIVTHLYHPQPGGLIDRQGKIRQEYRDARERGVLMETGLDRWHTDFEVMKRGVGEGFWPDIISTDVTRFNVEPFVRDVLFTASKLMAAGMPLEESLAAITINPARAMTRPQLAELKEGGPANITVLELLKEDITFVDFFGQSLKGKERLCCHWLINKGKVVK